mmetsp:Transcript_35063/g.79589  ORF Transcript_35063/g.79589 Transcript_35063/m.79589 type:complete len:161 (-) Transcript_35063:13-495(-)
MTFKPRDASYYGTNLNLHDISRPLNEATGRPRSMPPEHHTLQRLKTGKAVTFEDPHRRGTLMSARVKRYDAYTEKYTVEAAALTRSNLRASQLREEAPSERGDHIELLHPTPPLRSARAHRDFCQWRDEFPAGRKIGRWHRPALSGGMARSLNFAGAFSP